jgi:hypothetical protein
MFTCEFADNRSGDPSRGADHRPLGLRVTQTTLAWEGPLPTPSSAGHRIENVGRDSCNVLRSLLRGLRHRSARPGRCHARHLAGLLDRHPYDPNQQWRARDVRLEVGYMFDAKATMAKPRLHRQSSSSAGNAMVTRQCGRWRSTTSGPFSATDGYESGRPDERRPRYAILDGNRTAIAAAGETNAGRTVLRPSGDLPDRVLGGSVSDGARTGNGPARASRRSSSGVDWRTARPCGRGPAKRSRWSWLNCDGNTSTWVVRRAARGHGALARE